MGETQIVERLTSWAAKITRLSPVWYNVGTNIDKDYKRTQFEGHVGEGGGIVSLLVSKETATFDGRVSCAAISQWTKDNLITMSATTLNKLFTNLAYFV